MNFIGADTSEICGGLSDGERNGVVWGVRDGRLCVTCVPVEVAGEGEVVEEGGREGAFESGKDI